MNVDEWDKKLRAEGFRNIYDWRDAPGVEYLDHSHLCQTAHIILDGEMNITMDGQTRTYRAGDRFDISAEAVHSARMGPTGCHYLVGEK